MLVGLLLRREEGGSGGVARGLRGGMHVLRVGVGGLRGRRGRGDGADGVAGLTGLIAGLRRIGLGRIGLGRIAGLRGLVGLRRVRLVAGL